MPYNMNIAIFALLSVVFWTEVRGAEWIVGNEEHPWEEWGGQVTHSLGEDGQELPNPWVDWVGVGFQLAGEKIVARMDISTEPGQLQPVRIDSSINLSIGIGERSIRVKPVSDRSVFTNSDGTSHPYFAYIDAPFNIVDGDSDSYIYNKAGVEFKLHTMFYLDLGWPFPVNRIRFYTRSGFELFHIPSYTLSINNGDRTSYVTLPVDPTGYNYWDQAIKEWASLSVVPINTKHDIDIRFPTQWVRYISLGDTLIAGGEKTRWELAEVEIYGDGYVPGFVYTSAIIPFDNAANWGTLRWHAQVDSGATIAVRTRTGQTPEPYRYFAKTGLGLTGQTELTRDEYVATQNDINRRALAGPVVENTDHWSFWSLPYTQSGQTITSPAPARYFQFELAVTSSAPQARVKVDSLIIEFSTPPVAQELVGEVGYGQVEPGSWEIFRYAIRARFGAEDTGFNAVQIVTPDQVDAASIEALEIDGTAVVPDSVQLAADGFTLFLPEHLGPASAGDSTLVTLTFATRVYVHGTVLSGSVFDSRRPEMLPQAILPGDATNALNTDGLQVEWQLGGSLLGSTTVSSNPFTPNGDGLNDQLQIDYGLFQVDRAVPVSFTVYDLTGRMVYQLTQSQDSGPQTMRWDGANNAGKRVPPGLYLWRITADTAAAEYVQSGTVAVVY